MKTKSTTQKNATITLRANGSTMALMASLRKDGSVVASVVTKDPEKKTSRGMTSTHKDMAAAKTHLATLAEQAAKLGWQRGTRIPAAKPDAFSKLPAPKVA